MLFKDVYAVILEIGNYVRLHSEGNCTLAMESIIYYYYCYDYPHSCNLVI